jgi:23S rRNA (adenine2503-C2)-methyltransferase
LKKVPKVNLLGLPRPKLEAYFLRREEAAFRATQVMKWIHQQGVTDFSVMTNLSKGLRAQLAAQAEVHGPRLLGAQHSADGTRKWVLRLTDDNAVETVFIPETDRGTLCVSSQVGCALDCTFCSTARQGFNRNLTAAEIIGQVWFAKRVLGEMRGNERIVTNVVLMGMGEPLLNFKHVVDAIELMMDDNAYGLGKRKVTLSTSGVVPAMDRLHATLDVSLAVSLHAANDELRSQLVPLNRKFPIRELMAACRRFLAGKNRKHAITFEYVMLKDVNDSPQQAQELVKLVHAFPAKVNLIPFNPFPRARYQRSDDGAIDRFASILQQGGVTTITRRTRGEDIGAACGQLVGRVQDRRRRQEHFVRLERHLPQRHCSTS